MIELAEQAKPTSIDWLGNIPASWSFLPTKRIVATKITDGPHETPELVDDGIPFISAEAVKGNRIDFERRRGYITPELHAVYSRKCKPQKYDIFIIKSGATTGNVAYVDTDLEFNIWSPLAVVRCNKRIANFKFVFYQMQSDVFRKQVELSWTFGTQENIGMGVLERIKIILPPLDEQQRIADYLDASCEAIDRAVETKQKQLDTLDSLRKSIIQKAVTQGLDPNVPMKDSGVEWLGPIPKHWSAKKLKRVFAEVDYGISESTEQEGNFAILKMGNIVDREIVFTKIEYVDDVPEKLVLQTDDLLFNRTNSLDQVAKVAVFRGSKDDCVSLASYLVRLRTTHHNHPHYVNYLVNSERFLGLARKMAIPSVQQANLNPTRYCLLEVPVPPLEEQGAIARYLDEKTKQIASVHEQLNQQVETLNAYRKSLIHECVTGKRRISIADLKKVQLHA